MNSYLMLLLLLLHMNKVEGSGLSKKEAYGECRHGLDDDDGVTTIEGEFWGSCSVYLLIAL